MYRVGVKTYTRVTVLRIVRCRTARELSMAHIHLPDGAFSIQWLIFWWVLAAAPITTAFILAPADDHRTATQYHGDGGSTSFAIFQVNAPFAGGDLADYNAHTERVRQ